MVTPHTPNVVFDAFCAKEHLPQRPPVRLLVRHADAGQLRAGCKRAASLRTEAKEDVQLGRGWLGGWGRGLSICNRCRTLFPTVPVDSSAASMPFPALASRLAVAISSSAYLPVYAFPSMLQTQASRSRLSKALHAWQQQTATIPAMLTNCEPKRMLPKCI